MASIKLRIDQDLKQALLAGDKALVSTLRVLKSAILYAEVAQGKRGVGLGDHDTIALLVKEAKKRQESADLYRQGGKEDRAQTELDEKAIIERYLPEQLSEPELERLVDEVISATGATGVKMMGLVISGVKDKAAGRAEASRIAAIVKERLSL